jgi:hypothetical protein
MIKPKRILFCMFISFFTHAGAQTTFPSGDNKPSSVRAKEATDELTLLVESIGDLDKLVTVCLYGNITVGDMDSYSRRLSQAEDIISRLDEIDKLFKIIAEKDPTEKDYLLKQAYSKVIELSIISRKVDYLDFLRIASMSKDQAINQKYSQVTVAALYEEKYSKWNSKSEKLIREARNLIRSYLDKHKTNIDALSLRAILLYYEGKYEEAIKDINLLLSQSDGEEKGPGLSEKYIGYLQAWLAQVYLQNNHIQECSKSLEMVRIMSEPEKSIFWAENVIKSLKNKELKNHDIRITAMEVPANVKFYLWRKLNYTKSTGKDAAILQFKIVENQQKLSISPQELLEKMNLGWEMLTSLEMASWNKAQSALTAVAGKPYDNPNSFYVNVTNIKKKKLLEQQVSLFAERFDNAYDILNTFRFTRKSWTTLINSNPGISFFRLNRIKTNLALFYLAKNSETFLNVFNFMKVENKRIDNALLNSIQEEFKEPVENEIKQDIEYLEKNNPDNIMFMLTKAEVLSYMEEPGTALKLLEEINAKIKPGSTVNNIDARSYIELYKAYIYLRLGQYDYLKQSIQTLESYPYFDKYIKDFKVYIKFKEDEKLYKTN